MANMTVSYKFDGPPPSPAQILQRLKLHTGLDDITVTDEEYEGFEIEHHEFGLPILVESSEHHNDQTSMIT
jgi:hypothetical protein